MRARNLVPDHSYVWYALRRIYHIRHQCLECVHTRTQNGESENAGGGELGLSHVEVGADGKVMSMRQSLAHGSCVAPDGVARANEHLAAPAPAAAPALHGVLFQNQLSFQ